MRDLKPGDRVKITGPWGPKGSEFNGGDKYIGRFATVVMSGSYRPNIDIDGSEFKFLSWLRENLRALPRRK